MTIWQDYIYIYIYIIYIYYLPYQHGTWHFKDDVPIEMPLYFQGVSRQLCSNWRVLSGALQLYKLVAVDHSKSEAVRRISHRISHRISQGFRGCATQLDTYVWRDIRCARTAAQIRGYVCWLTNFMDTYEIFSKYHLVISGYWTWLFIVDLPIENVNMEIFHN